MYRFLSSSLTFLRLKSGLLVCRSYPIYLRIPTHLTNLGFSCGLQTFLYPGSSLPLCQKFGSPVYHSINLKCNFQPDSSNLAYTPPFPNLSNEGTEMASFKVVSYKISEITQRADQNLAAFLNYLPEDFFKYVYYLDPNSEVKKQTSTLSSSPNPPQTLWKKKNPKQTRTLEIGGWLSNSSKNPH